MENSFSELKHPYAWLDYDALDANIAFVKKQCGNKQIRIATKSIRSVELLKYIANKLGNVSGFMTFTADETLYLIERGLDRCLIGYPVFERHIIKKLLIAQQSGKQITFMVDAKEQLNLLNEVAQQLETKVNVCIDCNVSTQFPFLYFGTKRSPIHNVTTLTTFMEEIERADYIEVVGVMAYDAQIAGVADIATSKRQEMKAKLIRQLKKRSLLQVTSWRQFAVAHVKAYSNLQFVNGGGSGSMAYCADERDITEITVGSAFFAPALFDNYESLQLKPAAGFALRVTRKFDAQTVVCHGGGYIASGAPSNDRLPQFLHPDRFAYTSLEGAGEVQTPIIVKKGRVNIGDTIFFRHAKAGELCERFTTLHTTRGGQYVGPILTYRGDGQCFL